jgi:hypothetical protein
MPEELFFLFIASCISLWLIQLAIESIERRRDRRRIQRGTARERYRGHLILVKAHQEPDTDDWSATAHIQFNQDNLTFRDVHLDRLLNFPTKTSAEKQALKEAKLWVDERLGKAYTFAR